jgi:hypothetical protein
VKHTRTNVLTTGVNAGAPWRDVPLRASGLFGPVRLELEAGLGQTSGEGFLRHRHGVAAPKPLDPARKHASGTIVAVILFALGFTTTLVAPQRLVLVWSITEAKAVSDVVIPIVFWCAIALCSVYLAHAGHVALSRAAARVLFAGFATHVVLLLAASVPRVTDRGAYSTSFYWMYARLFCAAVLATSLVWLGLAIVRRWGTAAYLTLPVALPCWCSQLASAIRRPRSPES